MADFPSGVFTPREMVNKQGAVFDPLKTKVIYAEDFNVPQAEIEAIEIFLRGGSSMVGIATTAGGGSTPRVWVDGSGFLRYS